jgi:hypothetical protein
MRRPFRAKHKFSTSFATAFSDGNASQGHDTADALVEVNLHRLAFVLDR